jgi:dihydroflavonol-4-reductase
VRFEHLPHDWQPTPHGKQLALAATGKLPFYVKDWTGEVVGIEDAATALLLAAEKGRNGERYIISDRFMGVGELYETAADASGVKPPRFGIPLWAVYVMGYLGDAARIALRRDTVLSRRSVGLMHIWPTLDHGKAERELGWQPGPVHDSVRRAAQFLSGESTPIATPARKTGSALRMPAARPGLTINMCRMTSR